MGEPTPQFSSFLRLQSNGSKNPVQVLRAVVLDLDFPALLAMMQGNVRGKVTLEPVLDVQDSGSQGGRGRAGLTTRRFDGAGIHKVSRDELLGSTHRQNCAE